MCENHEYWLLHEAIFTFCCPLNMATTGGITPEFNVLLPKSCQCGLLSEESSDFQSYLLLLSTIWVTSWNFQRTADCDVPWFISAPKAWTLVKCEWFLPACLGLHCMGILIWSDQLSTLHVILLFEGFCHSVFIFSAFLYCQSALPFLTWTTTWINTGLEIKK